MHQLECDGCQRRQKQPTVVLQRLPAHCSKHRQRKEECPWQDNSWENLAQPLLKNQPTQCSSSNWHKARNWHIKGKKGNWEKTLPRVGDKSRIRRSKASTPFYESGEPGSQLGDSWSSAEPGRWRLLKAPTAEETSVDSCGPEHRSVLRDSGSQTVGNLETSVGEKGKTSAASCGPEHPQSETSGRQAGYKRRIMRPKASTDKCDTSAELCGPEHPRRT